jgi:quercetin dioxygenase-like cupin family protein
MCGGVAGVAGIGRGAGDIVHIPAGIPHSLLVPSGKHITYVLLKIPA